MTLVLNEDLTVSCAHTGTVTIPPGTGKMSVSGGEVITADMIALATVAGCTNVGSGLTPCTAVTSIISGKATKLQVSGSEAMLEDAVVAMNSVPPSNLSITLAGQTKLDSV